jgi:hypothetical protein
MTMLPAAVHGERPAAEGAHDRSRGHEGPDRDWP